MSRAPIRCACSQINESNAISLWIYCETLWLLRASLSLSQLWFSILGLSVYLLWSWLFISASHVLLCAFVCVSCPHVVSVYTQTSIYLCVTVGVCVCVSVWWLFMLHCGTRWLVLTAAQLPAVLVAGCWLKPIRLAMAPSQWPLTPPTPGLITCWLAHAGPPPVGTEG